ncbi:MAG: MarR family transcriptional regulator [Atopobiaceae bacterium]|jgi:DNA-binding MarR family transcriptional regulator|nr:MarR family transcriptional regulator [Atopobiaceae bacterium]MCH4180521.1 MarR family transcriptional regulator [Atopobiaceae bacterium]MCH4214246.1 MarR family transcriptional regulator [Atopobiaceae bacterium]MCH4229457.1 MarR family transcriptional regulator [Atopobiaceae bacterium]MCH4276071.1 MarR family transcriptional regulator [Atopobiaceae bacterium]
MTEPERTETPPTEPLPECCYPRTREEKLLSELGYCGHYLHFYGGGRSGRTHILTMLLRNDGQMDQRRIQETFQLKAGSLSEVLAKLERDGLISRDRSPQDRRQLVVSLTERGHAEACEEKYVHERFKRECFTCLTPDEQDELLTMLEKVHDRWESLDD